MYNLDTLPLYIKTSSHCAFPLLPPHLLIQLEEMQAQMQQLQSEMLTGAQNLEVARSVPAKLNLQDFTVSIWSTTHTAHTA